MTKRPLTMTAEQEEQCVEMLRGGPCGDRILAELKAERAAHDASENKLRDAESRFEQMCQQLDRERTERDASEQTIRELRERNDELSIENAELSRRQEFTAREVGEAPGIDELRSQIQRLEGELAQARDGINDILFKSKIDGMWHFNDDLGGDWRAIQKLGALLAARPGPETGAASSAPAGAGQSTQKVTDLTGDDLDGDAAEVAALLVIKRERELSDKLAEWIEKRGIHGRNCSLGNCLCGKQAALAQHAAMRGLDTAQGERG